MDAICDSLVKKTCEILVLFPLFFVIYEGKWTAHIGMILHKTLSLRIIEASLFG